MEIEFMQLQIIRIKGVDWQAEFRSCVPARDAAVTFGLNATTGATSNDLVK
ncbi:hypothetical protein G6L16_006685 [Agrobacterium tumefaciens]|uniref:hypothetical protein n=1 Tax=Rhizobium/Agrobacterium group TaxID=227290 RepID=UPI0015735A64|nr:MULTISPECIES: hypothetical protein [Rhizobium/Agrobacterium group]MDH7805492.1 hypothetical protein [Rhizobium sp. AN67]MDQ4407006.1 hypothetical protein [Rhizobium sp. AN63]NSZ63023.1 hypothetical protein [Agrobacterium tumefaciens]NTA69393.1 hypothetical protein [Agrobacterium tumefaciens]WIE39186.1 hypothetical protein G6L16_006685 [Agrobacterium tumefaciens]